AASASRRDVSRVVVSVELARLSKNRKSASTVVTRVPPSWTNSRRRPRRPWLHQRWTEDRCRRRPPRRPGIHGSLGTAARETGGSRVRSMDMRANLQEGWRTHACCHTRTNSSWEESWEKSGTDRHVQKALRPAACAQ